jgi:hypothetical protein
MGVDIESRIDGTEHPVLYRSMMMKPKDEMDFDLMRAKLHDCLENI